MKATPQQVMLRKVEDRLRDINHTANKDDIMAHANILYLGKHIDKDQCLSLRGMSAGLKEDQVTAAEIIKNLYSQNQLGEPVFTNL